MKVKELKTGNIYTVYGTKEQFFPEKGGYYTFFLLWYNDGWQWRCINSFAPYEEQVGDV